MRPRRPMPIPLLAAALAAGLLALPGCASSEGRPATDEEIKRARQGTPADPPPDQLDEFLRERQRGRYR